MRDPVESYFAELRDIHDSGAAVAETSFYGPLATLLSDVGQHLKPKVTAIVNLRNTGAGIPDGGLFTANQLKGWGPGQESLLGQVPSRGAIEVKGTSSDAFATAHSEQVARYAERYGLVLVTNLRDWVLVCWKDGAVCELESLRLARTEAGFWTRVRQPKAYAESVAEGLTEFLKRVMLQRAPLSDPKDLAWFLASYARTARLRLEHTTELHALDQLRGQLEQALGLRFEGEKGDHFFRSTLVQTLFYGMFAAWVLGIEHGGDGAFEWRRSAEVLDVPFISALFYQFANPARLGPLRIAEVLDWAEGALNRVVRDAFFERFKKEHAVQYFYEPFLEAFDPELRKELGVWYTPDEVVRYMVARVDRALKQDLGIADGLADPSVYVLDPCCGTGAYLIESLRTIGRTLETKSLDALTLQEVKRAAMDRVIGFEILPAPFVISHLQLGLLLVELGVPLSHAATEHERVAVYLTNALTGWTEETADPNVRGGQTQLLLEFEQERDAADKVKREAPILVVLGNPPYNGYSGVAEAEEGDLIEPYKRGLAEWGVTKNYLDDPYVRFFRLAERAIAEHRTRGVVCLISTYSYLSDRTYVQMRQHLLGSFDRIWIDCLNGDSRRTGKTTPDGKPDPSIFSTERSRQGIQVGTAIATMICTGDQGCEVRYRDLWGIGKRSQLSDMAADWPGSVQYELVLPNRDNWYSLRPSNVSDEYKSWAPVDEIGRVQPQLGLNENRGGGLQNADRRELISGIESFVEGREGPASGLNRAAAGYDPDAMRNVLKSLPPEMRGSASPYLMRPFDQGWAFLSNVRGLWNRGRPVLRQWAQGSAGFLLTRRAAAVRDEGLPAVFTRILGEQDLLRGHAYFIPFECPSESGQTSLTGSAVGGDDDANLSARARDWLAAVPALSTSSDAWYHVLAVLYSRQYLEENRAGIAGGWPRVPLPQDIDVLSSSVVLGRLVAQLLDTSQPVESYDLDRLAFTGVISSSDGQLDPAKDLSVTAHWGIAGRGGICMPSSGRTNEREYSSLELEGVADVAASLGLSANHALGLLGHRCMDVYLNDVAFWRCVPENVWRYTVGGYQVIKKWLSYRERCLLGRSLSEGEVRYVTEMIRRISALALMGPALDANYERVRSDVWEWSAQR